MAEWHASIDVPATAEGVAVARRVTTELLTGWGAAEPMRGDAELVISELVTNAYRHAPGPDSFELEITARTSGVRISLADGSSVRPLIRELAGDAASGRGMLIVEALASSWGADDYRGGKRVWVDLDEAASSPIPGRRLPADDD